MKPGDLVAWKEGGFLEPKGLVSTFLILHPDPTHSNLSGKPVWRALSWRGNMVVVHEDSMKVVNEAGG